MDGVIQSEIRIELEEEIMEMEPEPVVEQERQPVEEPNQSALSQQPQDNELTLTENVNQGTKRKLLYRRPVSSDSDSDETEETPTERRELKKRMLTDSSNSSLSRQRKIHQQRQTNEPGTSRECMKPKKDANGNEEETETLGKDDPGEGGSSAKQTIIEPEEPEEVPTPVVEDVAVEERPRFRSVISIDDIELSDTDSYVSSIEEHFSA